MGTCDSGAWWRDFGPVRCSRKSTSVASCSSPGAAAARGASGLPEQYGNFLIKIEARPCDYPEWTAADHLRHAKFLALGNGQARLRSQTRDRLKLLTKHGEILRDLCPKRADLFANGADL
jgi:hypothetical protein